MEEDTATAIIMAMAMAMAMAQKAAILLITQRMIPTKNLFLIKFLKEKDRCM